jgi:glycosyltransferase involved in cell wall biosynthesis
MLGTRGVPARYGGFETAVEEVGSRLAERGHDVVVYCRQPGPSVYQGMQRVELQALRRRALETLSHSFLSSLHAMRDKPDVALLFNAANSPVLPLLHAARIPVAVHVDGLEWKRSKWSGAGRKYYLAAEGVAVAWADALIADARGIAAYYETKFGADTELIAYGAPQLPAADPKALAELDLSPGGYHLVVARTEPENHVHLIVDAYRASGAKLPLVVVGGVVYETDYQRALAAAMEHDERIRSIGTVHDQDLLNSLYAGALTYVHGHSVGGTNPSLLRAMGAGTCVLAMNNVFNEEVLSGAGRLFADADELRELFEEFERFPATGNACGRASRKRSMTYDWDLVADQYEDMCKRLAAGQKRTTPPLRWSLRQAKTPDASSGTWPRQTSHAPLPLTEAALVSLRQVG